MYFCIWMFVIFITAKSNSSIKTTPSIWMEFAVLPCEAAICLQGRFVSNLWMRLLECTQRPEESTVRKCRKGKILSYLETGEVINENLASNKHRHSALFSFLSFHQPNIQTKFKIFNFGQHFCFMKRSKLISLQSPNKCSWRKCTVGRWGIMCIASVWLKDSTDRCCTVYPHPKSQH